MIRQLKTIFYVGRSVFFSLALHGAVIALLLAEFWWPFSKQQIPLDRAPAIQALAVSLEQINQRKIERELKKQEERRLQELAEQKKREEEVIRKAEEEKKRKAEEAKRKKAEEQERARKAEEERKRKEAEEKKRREEEARRKAEEEALRQAEAERLKNQAIRALSSLHDQIREEIEENWRRPSQQTEGLQVLIRVRVGRNGDVLSAIVTESSGDPQFDHSAELAVMKASPLPFPTNPKYYDFIKEFNLRFNPDSLDE